MYTFLNWKDHSSMLLFGNFLFKYNKINDGGGALLFILFYDANGLRRKVKKRKRKEMKKRNISGNL